MLINPFSCCCQSTQSVEPQEERETWSDWTSKSLENLKALATSQAGKATLSIAGIVVGIWIAKTLYNHAFPYHYWNFWDTEAYAESDDKAVILDQFCARGETYESPFFEIEGMPASGPRPGPKLHLDYHFVQEKICPLQDRVAKLQKLCSSKGVLPEQKSILDGHIPAFVHKYVCGVTR